GTCNAITVVAKDAYGNPSPVSADQLLGLATSLGGAYSDNGCTSSINVATLATGQSQVTFYFKSNGSGPSNITVSGTGMSNGTISVTVNPDVPNKLVITGPS